MSESAIDDSFLGGGETDASFRSTGASNDASNEAPINTEGLPILDHRDRLMTAIHAQRVTCIEGETGCGKSTQVPQFILDDWKRYLEFD